MLKSLRAQSAALLTVVAIAAVLPAQAEDAKAKEGKSKDAKSMGHCALMAPVRAASMATGLVVGVPVAVLRRSSNRSLEYTNRFADNIGGKDSAPPVMFASILGIPRGILVGTGEGIYYGGKNAFCTSVDKPFGLASFSLADDLEGSK
jgi:hypothetical protein